MIADQYSPHNMTRSRSSTSAMVLAMLPSLLSRSIPRLRTIKQAIHSYSTTPPTSHVRHHTRNPSASSIDSITPPPSYVTSEDELDRRGRKPSRRYSLSRPNSSSSSNTNPTLNLNLPSHQYQQSQPSTTTSDTTSGIQWRYADPGLALLSLAASSSPSNQPPTSHNQMLDSEQYDSTLTPRLARTQYVAGVACLLRGLPGELSGAEVAALREAAPVEVRYGRAGSEVCGDGMDGMTIVGEVDCDCGQKRGSQKKESLRRTMLSRGVAGLTLGVVLLVSFLLPYLRLLVTLAWRYDRRHRLSERAIAQGVVAVKAVRARAVVVVREVCAMDDGRVGEAIRGAGMYVVQGLSGGVYDGLGEGLLMLGLRTGLAGGQSMDTINCKSVG